MSGFYGGQGGVASTPGQFGWLVKDGVRLRAQGFRYHNYWIQQDEPFRMHGYLSPWWPMKAGLDASGGEMLVPIWREEPELNTGAVAKVVFTGVTRDAYGSPLGSCIVKLFKTADVNYPLTKDTKIDEVTSDPTSGAFSVMSPYYPDAHYIVSYKAGSPDVEGTSVNTLIGA